jgi:hypothetical protein
MYPKNVIKKKTEHQIQITKSWTQSCKKAWQETGQGRAGKGRAASGKKLSGPEGIAR